jgi:hypothetical protein
MADDKEQVGTVTRAPKPLPVTTFDWLPEWVPGADLLKNAMRQESKSKSKIEGRSLSKEEKAIE